MGDGFRRFPECVCYLTSFSLLYLIFYGSVCRLPQVSLVHFESVMLGTLSDHFRCRIFLL